LIIDNDHVAGFQCMVKDVTEKKKIEFELRNSESIRKENEYRLTAILENTTTLIYIKDLTGRYITANKRFKEVFEVTDEMVINRTDFDFNTREKAEHYRMLDEEVIARLMPVESEELIKTSKGNRNLLLVKFPLFNDKNEIFGISGIATDITERVQSREKLESALRKAKEAKALQEHFLANMSHEIRTPLNGIKGMTNLLCETDLTEEQREFTTMIQHSLNNLTVMVNDVLDFSNIKAGKLTLENTRFNVSETVEMIKQQFGAGADRKGLSMDAFVDANIPSVLQGDPTRLKQVLANLVGNAVKFTHSGIIKIYATLNSQTDTEVAINYKIQDTGIGIAENKQKSIFDSFSQVNTSTTRSHGGSGLGLAISRSLVELQGGTISVESKVGQGSVFSFTISYAGKQAQVSKIDTPDHSFFLSGKRFLVIEDNEISQRVIGIVLKKAGGIVEAAYDGQQAMAYFDQGRQYDLVITDLQMPVMDGYEVARHIRTELNIEVPIIAMTATALNDEQEKCKEAGINEFMLKPFDFNQLYQTIGSLLSKNKRDEELKTIERITIPRLFDLSMLNELGDPESVLEVINTFLNNTPAEIYQFPELLATKNWSVLHKQAHKIKGALALLQATQLSDLLGNIEKYTKDIVDFTLITTQVNGVVELFGSLTSELNKEVENIRTSIKPPENAQYYLGTYNKSIAI
jgi:PAS domain S-box-containing protein